MKTSVIICTRNRVSDLIKALESINKQTVASNELIIVDSSDIKVSDVDEFQKVFTSELFEKTKLIYHHTTPGLTKQRNEGIDCASGDILYFFDDDVALEPTYIEEMNRVYEKHPEYAGGMGSVTNIGGPPSKWYKRFRKFFLLQRDYADGRFTWSGMPTHAYGRKEFLEVEVLGGCCFSFRKNIVKKHLFDESLGYYAYMEDCDISKRISDVYKLFFNPRARLQHFHSPVARDRIVDNRAMYIKNYSYLFFKNFYPKNKLRLFGYIWSLQGLCLEAILCLRWSEFKGYWKGFFAYWLGR